MELNVTGAFVYFEIPIFGGIPISQTTVSFFLVTVALRYAALGISAGWPAGMAEKASHTACRSASEKLPHREMMVFRATYCLLQ